MNTVAKVAMELAKGGLTAGFGAIISFKVQSDLITIHKAKMRKRAEEEAKKLMESEE